MSMLRAAARAAFGKLARRVARDGLFEKPGERAPTPPVPGPASAGLGAARSGTEPAAQPPAAALCRPVGLRGLLERLAEQDGPLVIHHWATWCEPCEQELPLIQTLAERLEGQAEVLGLCWDAFQSGVRPGMDLEVGRYAAALGVQWPSLLLTDSPGKLFTAMAMDFEQIPQTRVLASDGRILLQHNGALSPQDIERVQALIKESL